MRIISPFSCLSEQAESARAASAKGRIAPVSCFFWIYTSFVFFIYVPLP
jgi:hypothetical protein